MQVDPMAASRRLRDWNDGAADVRPDYTPDSLDFQRDLRALLARAEAAGQSARNLSAKADAALREGEMLRRERDAATAERDRLAMALNLAANRLEILGRRFDESGDGSAGFGVRDWAREAFAALASIKKEPTDGE